MKFSKLLLVTALLGGLGAGESALAQQGVDEIVVTGRLKQEAITDIAASVIAIPGAELQEKGIVDLQLLQNSVPNFRYTTNVGPSDNLIIRGIGTIGSGPHFEPGVGQQLNGVAYTRSRFGRAGLIDTAQVEVLRGPQGAVTGRNTSLGLVNIVPNKPTDEFEASLFTRYDFEDNEGHQLEGVISGPITEGMRARLAINIKDQDGFIDNINIGGTAGTKDDVTVRGILDFDLGDRGNFELFGQHLDAERDGKPREIVNCSMAALNDPFIGNGDCSLDRRQSNQAVLAALGNETLPERFDIDLYTIIGTINYDLTDTVRLTSITSHTDYTILDRIDTDLSPLGRLDMAASARRSFVIADAQDYTQFTQELRLAGNLENGLAYIVGALYNEYEVDFSNNSSTEGIGPGPYRPVNRYRFGNQENDGYSVFFDLTYDFAEQYTVNGGVRWISEDRAARAGQVLTRTGEGLTISNYPGGGPGPDCFARSGLFSCTMFPTIPEFFDGTLLDSAAGLDPSAALFVTNVVPDGPMHEVNDEDVTWNLNLQYRPDDDTMYYASVATGFKAGGFILAGSLSQATLEENFSFGPEDTLNTEIGGRHVMDTANGTFNFNWTIFRMEINNQQVSSLDTVNQAQVISAEAEARTQGIEIDGSYKTENVTFAFDLAYTDAEYTDFANATCYNGQTAALGCTMGAQNRTGSTLAQAPEWQGGINIKGNIDFWDGHILSPYAEMRFIGEHFTDTELNPISLNDDYTEFNAGITLGNPDETWSLALIGTNLTDEITKGFFNESASVPSDGPGTGAFAFPNPGRQVALVLRLNLR